MRKLPDPATICFSCLLIAYLLLIALASFYLSDFVSPRRAARAGVGELFFRLDEFRLRWYNLRDISTNILLYMPLGLLVALLLECRGQLRKWSWHLAWGAGLSVVVETAQAFIGRWSDATDVLANSSGFILGYMIAYFSIARNGIKPAVLLGFSTTGQGDRLNTLVGMRFAYVAVVLITAALPLDISVSASNLLAKFQAVDGEMPRIVVNPLYHFESGQANLQYLTQEIMLFIPVAILSGLVQLRRNDLSVLQPALHCLLLGLAVEGGNLFILSGRSNIIVPIVGFLTGILVAAIIYSSARRAADIDFTSGLKDKVALLISLTLLYGLLVVSFALAPYEFELSLRALVDKLREGTNLLPFYLHFSTRSVGSAIDLVREFLLYVPAGILLTFWVRTVASGISLKLTYFLAVTTALAIAFFVELLQLAVVARYVDITDVLMAGAGGMAGVGLFRGQMSPNREMSYEENSQNSDG